MTRCPECAKAQGQDVDHTPYFTLPPYLVRFEHFLATKGKLGRAMGAVDPDLPTRGKDVPAYPIESVKHRVSCVTTLVGALTEMGYLEKGQGTGRWTSITGKDIRDVSARAMAEYFLRRWPPDPCRRHDDACRRCCLPHHVSMYNKTCEAFRKMAEWLYFQERTYNRPVWGKDKLNEVYAVARVVWMDRPPPPMNDVARVLAFRRWLMEEAPAGPYRGHDHGAVRETALARYEETRNAKGVARELGLPYTTIYYWVRGRKSGIGPDRIRAEMPRLYGWALWFITEIGARYEEMAHAEFPLDGPYAKWDSRAGTLTLIGKGKFGGKTRPVTLTQDQTERLKEVVRWRTDLGELLRAWTGREPAPRLFVTLAHAPARSGHAFHESSGTWNETMRDWARRYNEHVIAAGQADLALDVDLVMSHRIGRAVSITKLALAGVGEKIIMEERGIKDHETVERYIRLDLKGKRGVLEAAEATSARRANGAANQAGAENGNEAVLEELRAMRKTIEDLQAQVRDKDKRINQLTDRLTEGKGDEGRREQG